MVDASHTPDEPGSEPGSEDLPAEAEMRPESASAGSDSDPMAESESETPLRPDITASAGEAVLDADAGWEGSGDTDPIPEDPSELASEAMLDSEQDAGTEMLEPTAEEGVVLEASSEQDGPYDSSEDFVDVADNSMDAGADAEGMPDGFEADAEPVSPETEVPPAPLAGGQAQPAAAEDDWGLDALDTVAGADAADAANLLKRSRRPKTNPIQRIQRLGQPALQPALQPLLQLWQRLLRGVRSRLPQVAALSDGVLSGILIGILVLLLTLINRLGHPSPAVVVTPTMAPDGATALELPSAPPPGQDIDSPTVAAPIDPDLERIADIQDQLTVVATSYASNLVVSVQANFAEDRLSANLSSGWYRLPRNQQDELAADLMGRSQSLDFATLELIDADGVMVARSPVVGKAMVILQRETPPEVPIPERPRYRITIDR